MPRSAVEDRSRPTRLVPPSLTLRLAIEAALADGAKPKDLTLELTHGDASSLKRDRTLAVADISFKDGKMRFLGVQANVGAVTVSRLNRAGAPAAN